MFLSKNQYIEKLIFEQKNHQFVSLDETQMKKKRMLRL